VIDVLPGGVASTIGDGGATIGGKRGASVIEANVADGALALDNSSFTKPAASTPLLTMNDSKHHHRQYTTTKQFNTIKRHYV
jgi:hypothetical protein